MHRRPGQSSPSIRFRQPLAAHQTLQLKHGHRTDRHQRHTHAHNRGKTNRCVVDRAQQKPTVAEQNVQHKHKTIKQHFFLSETKRL